MRPRPSVLPIAACAALLLAAFATPASADVQITIDKSSQQMSVSVDGQPRYAWPVSTGAGGYDTPGGSYQPFRMEATHFSREWDNAPMPHAIFFTKIGHAIHGTNQVRNLGRAASHGCVRLSPGHAATLFGLVKAQGMARTRVTVEGGEAPEMAARADRPARQARRDGWGADAREGAMPVGLRGGRGRAGPAAEPYRDPYRDPFGFGF